MKDCIDPKNIPRENERLEQENCKLQAVCQEILDRYPHLAQKVRK